MKDYYQILGILHTANEQEIKKAYRELVMKFHPDKNDGNSQAAENFKEVQEAYEILSHPSRRSAYNQQRWYGQNKRAQNDLPKITSYNIFHKCWQLNRYISTIDKYHINRQALINYLKQLLSPATLEILLKENDTITNELIIQEVLKSADYLPFQSLQEIGNTLIKLAAGDTKSVGNITRYLDNKKRSAYYSKYTPLAMLIVAIIICLLIYLFGNNNH